MIILVKNQLFKSTKILNYKGINQVLTKKYIIHAAWNQSKWLRVHHL